MKTSNIGYVHIKNPESLLQEATQLGVPTGKTRIESNGEVSAEFLPLNKGNYTEKVFLKREMIY